ncbi:MAG: apolipoprotein N-acyltransferase [Treponema sp.]|nr:apolipoprotein N-acyltransferase [Treponema sp.]
MALHALTVHLASSFWLANFRDFAFFTLGASALGTAVEAGLIGIIFHILPEQQKNTDSIEENAGKHPFFSFIRMMWFCSAWTSWEWLKSTGFLAYPWGTLFVAAHKWKLLTQIADITGVWGITFLYALFSAAFAEGIQLRSRIQHSIAQKECISNYRQSVRFVGAFFLAAGLYGLYQYSLPRVPEKYVNTIAVQQNIDPWETKEQNSIGISKSLTEQAVLSSREQGEEPDLIIWSEGILSHAFPAARFFYENNPEDESLSAFIARMGVPFIIGGITFVNPEKKHYSNSAIFFDKNGAYSGFYSKMHLVPFAEALPFKDSAIMKFFTKNILKFSSTLTQGKQYVLFKIPLHSAHYNTEPLENRKETHATISLNNGGASNPDTTWQFIKNPEENKKSYVCFTTPICFEDAFPEVCTPLFTMGSEVFFNITNDSWSKTASAEYQHFAIASYLSIEYRTTLVRCTNSGYSVVLDPAGKTVDNLDIFKTDVMCTKVPVFTHKATVFSMYGDWFAYTIFTLCSLYLLLVMLKIQEIPSKTLFFALQICSCIRTTYKKHVNQ